MEAVNHEYYVSSAVAKLLKQAGFDWEVCDGFIMYEDGGGFSTGFQIPYNFNGDNGDLFINYRGHEEVLSKPTLDIAQRWLREEHGISVQAHNTLEPSYAESWITKWFYDIVFIEYDDERSIDCTLETNRYNTYEEALEAGIKRTLEIILKKGE